MVCLHCHTLPSRIPLPRLTRLRAGARRERPKLSPLLLFLPSFWFRVGWLVSVFRRACYSAVFLRLVPSTVLYTPHAVPITMLLFVDCSTGSSVPCRANGGGVKTTAAYFACLAAAFCCRYRCHLRIPTALPLRCASFKAFTCRCYRLPLAAALPRRCRTLLLLRFVSCCSCVLDACDVKPRPAARDVVCGLRHDVSPGWKDTDAYCA